MKLACVCKVICKTEADHIREIFWIGVCHNGCNAGCTECDHRECQSIIAADHHEISWFVFDDLHDLIEITACFFRSEYVFALTCDAQLRCSSQVLTCTAGHIVHHDRQRCVIIEHFVVLE